MPGRAPLAVAALLLAVVGSASGRTLQNVVLLPKGNECESCGTSGGAAQATASAIATAVTQAAPVLPKKPLLASKPQQKVLLIPKAQPVTQQVVQPVIPALLVRSPPPPQPVSPPSPAPAVPPTPISGATTKSGVPVEKTSAVSAEPPLVSFVEAAVEVPVPAPAFSLGSVPAPQPLAAVEEIVEPVAVEPVASAKAAGASAIP